mmetsp:Transcript_16880/g.31701  ORF Transcript_16880/g.31701 Transcript_16880/m.31701 type:complete len:287 (+) Transcript_16880:2510-3370(+)
MRCPSSDESFSSARASSASALCTKLTKPQFLFRARSSSVRGHITLALLTGPNTPKISHSRSSVVVGARLPTYRLVVNGSPVSKDPGPDTPLPSSGSWLPDNDEREKSPLRARSLPPPLSPPLSLSFRLRARSLSLSFISSNSSAMSLRGLPPLLLLLLPPPPTYCVSLLGGPPLLPLPWPPLPCGRYTSPPPPLSLTKVLPVSPSTSNEATNDSYTLAASFSSCSRFCSLSSRAFWNRLFFCCPTAKVVSFPWLIVFRDPGCTNSDCIPKGRLLLLSLIALLHRLQ